MNKTIQVPLSEEDINTLKAGDYVYLSGIVLLPKVLVPTKTTFFKVLKSNFKFQFRSNK